MHDVNIISLESPFTYEFVDACRTYELFGGEAHDKVSLLFEQTTCS